jgi:hypothetical protein
MKARRDYTKATKARAKALFDIQAADSLEEITKRVAAKHPELIDTETGAILPVASVVELTPSTADVPRAQTKDEAAKAAHIKAMAEEMERMSTGTTGRFGKR